MRGSEEKGKGQGVRDKASDNGHKARGKRRSQNQWDEIGKRQEKRQGYKVKMLAMRQFSLAMRQFSLAMRQFSLA
jgi:hypothetical protein